MGLALWAAAAAGRADLLKSSRRTSCEKLSLSESCLRRHIRHDLHPRGRSFASSDSRRDVACAFQARDACLPRAAIRKLIEGIAPRFRVRQIASRDRMDDFFDQFSSPFQIPRAARRVGRRVPVSDWLSEISLNDRATSVSLKICISSQAHTQYLRHVADTVRYFFRK